MGLTSPDWCVENLTISEHDDKSRGRYGNLGVDGEPSAFGDGKEKVTESPTFSLRPLHVDKPVISHPPTSHQSSFLPSPSTSGLLRLAMESRGGASSTRSVESSGASSGVEALFEYDAVGWNCAGASNMMLMAAVGSLLARWRARMMSISEKPEPTTDRTTEICSAVTF